MMTLAQSQGPGAPAFSAAGAVAAGALALALLLAAALWLWRRRRCGAATEEPYLDARSGNRNPHPGHRSHHPHIITQSMPGRVRSGGTPLPQPRHISPPPANHIPLGQGRAAAATAARQAHVHPPPGPQPSAPRASPEVTRATEAEAEAAARRQREAQRLAERAAAASDPPEVRALREALAALQRDGRWEALIAAGDVYARGAFPRFRPNAALAMRCYRMAAMSPDGDVAGTGQVKYIEARDEPLNALDVAGAELPEYYGQELCRIALQRVRLLPLDAFQRPVAKRPRGWGRQQEARDERQEDHNNNNNNNNNNNAQRAFRRPAPPPAAAPAAAGGAARPPAALRRDAQNVHDHAVVKTIRHNLELLAGELGASLPDLNHALALGGGGTTSGGGRGGKGDGGRGEALLDAVRSQVLADPRLSGAEKSDAVHTLDGVAAARGQVNSSLGASEVAALSLVWARIQATRDPALRDNLLETLGKQLASGVENGHVVCSTGRFARIMGALDGVEPDAADADQDGSDNNAKDAKNKKPRAAAAAVRPMWAVREEIGTLAARVRDEVLGGLSAAERAAYEAGATGGAAAAAEARMRRELEARAVQTYVRELGMAENIIRPIVEQYQEAF
jgi:hypothetical protein